MAHVPEPKEVHSRFRPRMCSLLLFDTANSAVYSLAPALPKVETLGYPSRDAYLDCPCGYTRSLHVEE